jgi:hypothetical protein
LHRRLGRIGDFGNAEIQHLDDFFVFVVAEKNVFRFEVAMDDACGMRTRKGATNLSDYLGSFAKGEPPAFVKTLEQVFTLKQLHDNEGITLIDPVIEDLNHVRASELRRCSGFPLEPFTRIFAFGKFRIDELDCNVRVER